MDAPDKTTEGPHLQRLHIVDARAGGAHDLPSNLNSCTLCRSKLPPEARDLAIVQLHAAETTMLLRSATRVHANRESMANLLPNPVHPRPSDGELACVAGVNHTRLWLRLRLRRLRPLRRVVGGAVRISVRVSGPAAVEPFCRGPTSQRALLTGRLFPAKYGGCVCAPPVVSLQVLTVVTTHPLRIQVARIRQLRRRQRCFRPINPRAANDHGALRTATILFHPVLRRAICCQSLGAQLPGLLAGAARAAGRTRAADALCQTYLDLSIHIAKRF